MSSLQENSTTLDEKRRPFLRSGSLEKIRCSAYYSLQLAGSILTRESLKQLFELLITKSRNFLQKAFLLLSFPAFKMCCALVLFWIDAFTKYTGIKVVFEKKIASRENIEPEKTDTSKVQKRKTTRSPVKSRPTSASVVSAATATVNQEVESVPEATKSEDIHQLLQDRLLLSPGLSKSGSERSLLTDSNISISGRHNFGLVVFVYASATLVYLQLMVLAAFLHMSNTPPGLVFLVSSLAYIIYIVFKMCFVKRKSREDASPSKNGHNSPLDCKKISSDSPARGRLSRSTTRRFFDIHNKTLSKIKLL